MRAILTFVLLLAACGGDDEQLPDARPIDAAIDAALDAAPTCAGTLVGGRCWYKGAVGQSCTAVCAGHGGLDAATVTYAGSPVPGDRSNQAGCMAVAAALSALPFTAAIDNVNQSNDYGCVEEPDKARCELVSLNPTVAGSANPMLARFCTCNL